MMWIDQSNAFQAFLIAFTSDFIQKLVYRFHYGDGEMDGYVQFTLSKSPAANWVDAGRVRMIISQDIREYFVFPARVLLQRIP